MKEHYYICTVQCITRTIVIVLYGLKRAQKYIIYKLFALLVKIASHILRAVGLPLHTYNTYLSTRVVSNV